MLREQQFWVLGGDMRQAKLAQLLAKDGHRVHTFALEEAVIPERGLTVDENLRLVERGDCIILPLPVCGEEGMLNTSLSSLEVTVESVLDALSGNQIICGGRVDEETAAAARVRELTIYDYFAREELAVDNAVPTAEGCIQIAMEHLPITIHEARVLVVGYGRVGKMTAQRMGALGAKVSVAARRYEQLAWAQAMGFGTERVDQLAGWLCSYDLVVNTVPSMVLGRVELSDLRSDCLIIDLASKPGGVDMEAAAQLGRTVIWALSLPGKVAPITAGAAIKSTIYNILHETDS